MMKHYLGNVKGKYLFNNSISFFVLFRIGNHFRFQLTDFILKKDYRKEH